MVDSTPGRRLAVIDSNFPWKQSGFRYWENYEIYRQRPDTLFFATKPYTDWRGYPVPDSFPVIVHPFSQLVDQIYSEKITDIYCVFLSMALNLIGKSCLPNGYTVLGSNSELNILPVIMDRQLKLHTTIYPGGGLTTTTPIEISKLDSYYSTIFSNVQEVLKQYPGSVYVPGMINSEFYSLLPKPKTPPIRLVFSAHQGVRKNFPHMAEAFNQLDESFHLDIVGDWENYLHLLTNNNFTFHGLLGPEKLRDIYHQAHVFISCSTMDLSGMDGFPTTAAGDAMSTGCLLVSSNPRRDSFVLLSGVDYLEINETRRLVDILWWIKDHFNEAMVIGGNGTSKIRSYYDSKVVVSRKLEVMGLI
ncbi:glycosyltransferase [Paenibacillus sp. LjRoot153]|uniref:glycosyltransferase n=1 Tax=Paenibacillus sp. LjRoot153 TaxID=3342270 RepID=UPI003ED10893